MLLLTLFLLTIPTAPRITCNEENHLVIEAPPQLCHDVFIAFADGVQPNWRVNAGPFPIWIRYANDAKERGIIEYQWYYYDSDDMAFAERQYLLGLTFVGYKHRYGKKYYFKK